MLYLTNSWWDSCIGSTSLFKDYPTWIARYNSVLGTTPASQYVSFWQYSDSQTPCECVWEQCKSGQETDEHDAFC